MTLIGGIEIPKEGVKVVHDPEKVVNLLCDLPNSDTIFQMLEIYKEDGRPGKMIFRHKGVQMYMILLYRYPKWMEPEEVTNPSELVLFIAPTLNDFTKFFFFWFNREDENERKTVLFEIQDLIYEHLKIEKEEEIRSQQ